MLCILVALLAWGQGVYWFCEHVLHASGMTFLLITYSGIALFVLIWHTRWLYKIKLEGYESERELEIRMRRLNDADGD